MFQHIVTAWRIDRGCSRMLEHAKTDTIQQPSLWLLYNIAVQPCYFIIPWQHVLSCMWTTLLIYHDGSNNVVQVYSFIKLRIVCSNWHELAGQQHCSSWPAQLWRSSLSTGKKKPFYVCTSEKPKMFLNLNKCSSRSRNPIFSRSGSNKV